MSTAVTTFPSSQADAVVRAAHVRQRWLWGGFVALLLCGLATVVWPELSLDDSATPAGQHASAGAPPAAEPAAAPASAPRDVGAPEPAAAKPTM